MAEPARKLNPGEGDYEDKFQKPKLGVVQGGGEGGGTASSRENLRSVPTGAQIKSADELKKAENNSNVIQGPWKTDMKTDDAERQQLSGTTKGGNGKKGALAAGGVGAFLIGIAISFIMLLPLKIIGLIDSLANKMGAEVEHIVERRAEKIVVSKLRSEVLQTAAHAVAVGPLAAIRTTMLEKRLEKKGIKLTSDGSGGVNVEYNGKTTGKGLKNEEGLLKAINESGGKLTNDVIKNMVKEEVPVWRWFKRAKMAKWLRIKYGIKRFGTEKEKNTGDPASDAQDLLTDTVAEATAEEVADTGDGISCVMGEGDKCDVFNEHPSEADLGELGNGADSTAGDLKSSDGAADQQGQTTNADETKKINASAGDIAGSTGEALGSSSSGVASDIKDAMKKVARVPGQVSDKIAGAMAKILNKTIGKLIGKQITEEIVKKAAGPAALVLLAAQVVNLIETAHDNSIFTKLPSAYKARIYAKIFNAWQGYGDQIKDGQMSPELVGLLAQQMQGSGEDPSTPGAPLDSNGGDGTSLGTNSSQGAGTSISKNGVETSATFSLIQNQTPLSGDSLNGHQRIGQGDTNAIQSVIDDIANFPGFSVLAQVAKWINGAVGVLLGPIDWLAQKTGIAGAIGDAVAPLAKDFGGWIANDLLGFDVASPMDNGSKLYNDLGAGSSVSYNQYCKEQFGCHGVTMAQLQESQNAIAADNASFAQSKGFAYALFDTGNTNSFVSQLAINMPYTGQSTQFATVAATSFNLLSSIPAMIGSILSPRVAADTATGDFNQQLYGVESMGATESELDQPVDQNVLDGNACPDISSQHDGTHPLDLCSVDSATAQSIACTTASLDIDNSEQPSSTVDCSGGQPQTGLDGSNGGNVNIVDSAEAPSYCKDGSATGNQKIVCSAWIFDPLSYSQEGPRGPSHWDFIGCVKSNFAGDCATKYPPGNQRTVDCSSLATFAIYDGVGIDLGGYNTSGMAASSHLKKISRADAQPGDIILDPGSHTEVVVQNDPAHNQILTFGAHTSNYAQPKQVGPSSWAYSGSDSVSGGGETLDVYRVVP